MRYKEFQLAAPLESRQTAFGSDSVGGDRCTIGIQAELQRGTRIALFRHHFIHTFIYTRKMLRAYIKRDNVVSHQDPVAVRDGQKVHPSPLGRPSKKLAVEVAGRARLWRQQRLYRHAVPHRLHRGDPSPSASCRVEAHPDNAGRDRSYGGRTTCMVKSAVSPIAVVRQRKSQGSLLVHVSASVLSVGGEKGTWQDDPSAM